ncbi:MAG: 2'-5' RNA ligase family protein [Anaerolineales bacterium]
MHALVSLFDEKHEKIIHSLWQELGVHCGLSSINTTPFPHFSWLIAEDFDWERLDLEISDISKSVGPFTIQATGLGIFAGPNPVLYIPIVRTAELSRIHQLVWEKILPIGKELSPHYAPQNWMPHITLAFGELSNQDLSCALEKMAFRSIDWQISVKNIAVGYQIPGTTSIIHHRHEFRQ